MKTLTVYEARDGSRWDTQHRAIERDNLCLAVDEVMAPLGPVFKIPGNCDFENGHGYVQHDPEVVKGVKLALLGITRKLIPSWVENQTQSHGLQWPDGFLKIHPSWFCRMTEDGPACRAWSRLSCIDQQHREWGQSYYADHPEEADIQHEVGTPQWTAEVEGYRRKWRR